MSASLPAEVLPTVPPASAATLLAPPNTHVTVRGLTKAFGGVPLYTHFNLDLPRSKIVSIFGPNGCGKSTLMNMIAGLVPLDAGEILFDGKSLKDTQIGYVFQNYRDALFPWITAWDNIAYPLKRKGLKPAEVKARLEAYYGLDQPLPKQFGNYVVNLAQGDLGPSMKYMGWKVHEVIGSRIAVSCSLGAVALLQIGRAHV